MIGFVEDDTYAVFRDIMKFYKYFPTDNALLKKKLRLYACMNVFK